MEVAMFFIPERNWSTIAPGDPGKCKASLLGAWALESL